MRIRLRVIVGIAVLFGGAALHAQSADERLATRFYPAALDADFRANNAPDRPILRDMTLLRVDLDHSGNADYLAVAYSNGLASSLRILKGSGAANGTLIAESPDVTMGGNGKPVLEAVDIDDDGTPELVVQFTRATWIYKYSNGQLALFGPTREGAVGPTSDLGYVGFVDVDGDGRLDIVEAGTREKPETTLYRVAADGSCRRAGRAAFVDRFTTAEESHAVTTRTFTAKPGRYLLRIVNGAPRRERLVGRAEVRLNGVEVAHVQAALPGTRTLLIPIELRQLNVMDIDLGGDPDSELSITIVDENR
jgi:hypothetical protein